jgi:hypothetical protein
MDGWRSATYSATATAARNHDLCDLNSTSTCASPGAMISPAPTHPLTARCFSSDYDVTSDGKRFLMVELATLPQPRIDVVLDLIGALTARCRSTLRNRCSTSHGGHTRGDNRGGGCASSL